MYINRLTPERVKPWDICIAPQPAQYIIDNIIFNFV